MTGPGTVARSSAFGCAVALCALALAAPAYAVQVSCGQTISTDTKVSNNLTDCPGDGLIIDTDGVDLDLRGHTIDGDDSGGEDGIVFQAGVDNASVKNGRVQQFDVGVVLQGGDAIRVLGITARGNVRGFEGGTNTHLLMRNNRAIDSDGDGFGDLTASDSVIQNNTAQNSGVDGYDLELANSVFERNRSDRAVSSGIQIADSGGTGGNLIRDNLATRGESEGFSIEGIDDIVLRARASQNDDEGIDLNGATDARIIDSIVERNGTDGVLVDSDTGVLLKGNVASRNGDDGIDVQVASTTLRRNTANDNGGFGIDAVGGVTDLGGNRARGNDAAPPQCVNVSC